MGHAIAPPRLTRYGWLAMLWYLGAPVMALLLALDLVLYLLFTYGFGLCYGLWCLWS